MSKLIKYEGVPALYEREQAVTVERVTAISVETAPAVDLTAIPRDRRIFVPPLITSHTKLTNAAVAMRHLALATDEAQRLGLHELSCVKLSYDSKETLTVEGANRREHGVVRVKAKTRTPSPTWSVLVPAEALRSVMATLPNRPLELAPGDRLHLGHLSIQIDDGQFPDAPTVPPDVQGGEAKTIDFQSIISRTGLDSAVRFCSVVVNPSGASNLQHLVINPETKLAGGSDRRRARLMKLDVRSKPRLQHPGPFSMTMAAARAAVVLEESDFVFVSLESSADMVVGGRDDQSYAIVTDKSIQSGTPVSLFDVFPLEGVSSFVVARSHLMEFCRRAIEIFAGDDEVVSIFFGETLFRAKATARGEDIEREDLDWELRLIESRQTEIRDRNIFFDPRQLLEALEGAEGEDVTIYLQRRATRKDPVAIVGNDTTKMSIILPITGDLADDRDED